MGQRMEPPHFACCDVPIGKFVHFDGDTYQAKLHFMPICADENRRVDHGLLLQHTGENVGQFRRFGRLSHLSAWRIGFHEFKEVENSDWSEYEEFYGSDKYTISII
jgi:hypothetical protein